MAVRLFHCLIASKILALLSTLLLLIIRAVSIRVRMVRVAVVMLAGHESMRMRTAPMQYIIQHNINNQSSDGRDEHNRWLSHKLLVHDPYGGLVHDEQDHCPHYEDIQEGADELHPMVAEGNPLVHLFFGEVEEDKGEDEAKEVTYQVNGIRDDGDRFGDLASDDLEGNEERSDDDHHYQPPIIA